MWDLRSAVSGPRRGIEAHSLITEDPGLLWNPEDPLLEDLQGIYLPPELLP